MYFRFIFFYLLLLNSLQAGLITPIAIQGHLVEVEKEILYTDIHDYDVWQWLHAANYERLSSDEEAKRYYITRFFIEDTFDVIKITFDAGVFTAAFTPSKEDEEKELLQWLKPATEIINFWQ